MDVKGKEKRLSLWKNSKFAEFPSRHFGHSAPPPPPETFRGKKPWKGWNVTPMSFKFLPHREGKLPDMEEGGGEGVNRFLSGTFYSITETYT